jgi:hypothetical protein
MALPLPLEAMLLAATGQPDELQELLSYCAPDQLSVLKRDALLLACAALDEKEAREKEAPVRVVA